VPVPPTAVLAASTAKNSGGGGGFFILLLIIGLMVYLFTRSQRNTRKRQAQTQSAIEVGSRVITTSGMYGTVVSIADDAYELEIDDDVIVRFVKAAVTRLAPEPPAQDDADEADGSDTTAADAAPVTLTKPDGAEATHVAGSSSEA
jgi:preprotein translocase subunit YajC